VTAGESQVTTTFRDARLEADAARILKALHLCGPSVLQAFVVDGELQVIECKPRFGGASMATLAVGLNGLYWSLSEVLGDPAPTVFHRRCAAIRKVRRPTDRVIHDPDL
jgi:carbamoyl-phosphate synthase large subunit